MLEIVNNQFISTLDLSKFNKFEKNNIIEKLSKFNFDSLTVQNNIDLIKNNIENRKKGWSNFLRKGLSKIHRYNIPKLIPWNKLYGTEKQPLLQMYHRFKKHDHQRNNLLIALRERKKMRLNIRSERHEMYCAFDLAILNYLDIDNFGIGLFEITCSVEMLAKTINIYRIDKSGHARYDTLLNAINDYEKTKQIIVYREFDKEKKVYKPSRIWLTVEFFKERGYSEEDLRKLLKSREQYLYKKNIFNKTRELYQTKYLQRLDNAGILNPPSSIVKKLVKIKNSLLDMYYEKQSIKRAEKQKRQAQKEIDTKKIPNYEEIFSQYVVDNDIPPAQCYITKNKFLSKHQNVLSDKYWLDCLIDVGWMPE